MQNSPKFRVDLIPYIQDDGDVGKQRIVLKDPISEKYFQLSEYEFRFLKLLDGLTPMKAVIEKLGEAGHYYAGRDAEQIIQKAAQLGLLLGTKYSTASFQLATKQRMRQAERMKLPANLYYMFIPVLNPDEFLGRTVWIFRRVWNGKTALLAALAAVGAVYLLITSIPRIQLEYLFFFNWQNVILLWVTIALIKLVHEFSHAYAAKYFGLRVPEMGIAFLIFFPCLYCNTTDAWQLADRRQRIAISAAGIIAEGILAVLCAYIWYFTKPGLVNSLAFYMMTVSFVSTILFNGNPLLKFDGYFMLIDFLGLPNLASNSLKHLKYLFLNRALGREAYKTPAENPGQSAVFTVYGVAAFAYRVTIVFGIAAGVYYRFDKVLGCLLAALALGLFVIRPVATGAKNMYKARHEIRLRPAGFVALIFIAICGVFLFIPWSSRSVYPCFVVSQETRKLTVPLHTFVNEVFIREGSSVKKGSLLFQLDISELDLKLRQKQIQRNITQMEIQLLSVDEEHRSKSEGKEVELKQTEDEIGFLRDLVKVARTSINAPFDGVITNLDYRLQPGFQPGEGAVVGELQSTKYYAVHALVPASDIHDIHKGQTAEVWLPLGAGKFFRRKIDSIKSYSESDLRNSPFSSRIGGEVATEVRGEQQQDVPIEAFYDCSVSVLNGEGDIPLGMTGRMAVLMPPRSVITRVVNRILRTFNRESLF